MDEHLFIQGVLKGSKRFEVPKEWEDEVDLKGMTAVSYKHLRAKEKLRYIVFILMI